MAMSWVKLREGEEVYVNLETHIACGLVAPCRSKLEPGEVEHAPRQVTVTWRALNINVDPQLVGEYISLEAAKKAIETIFSAGE